MDNIKINIPKKSKYISTLRLTTSSIASTMNFNIDEIEDIKMIISEVCILLIKNNEENNQDLKLDFELSQNDLTVKITDTTLDKISYKEEDMSIMIIKSLSDKFNIEDNKVIIRKNINK